MARHLFACQCVLLVACSVSLACGQQSCEKLPTQPLPKDTNITSAKLIDAGPFTADPDWAGPVGPVDLPAFCRVLGRLQPTPDSDINFELWIPTKTWNGKFLQAGNGGFAGTIVYRSMIDALLRGYATASTDDGHKGATDVSWAKGHPEKMVDFAYRAVHLTAESSKAIVRSFYEFSPVFSYFSGCSEGGREALIEAQRFPDDFDGIIVGAPANAWTHQFAGFLWNEQALLSDPGSYVPPSKLPLLQSAALRACAGFDETKGGILEDPSQCHFNPSVIQCKGADQPDCLTAKQVNAVKKIYGGPINPRTRAQIYPGYEPGAEAAPENWPSWITGEAPGKSIQAFFANKFFGDIVFANPNWDFRTFSFNRDMAFADKKFAGLLNAINPDLSRFQAHGGKIIQYHGWGDSAVAPEDSIHYYQQVIEAQRGQGRKLNYSQALQRTKQFYRLYMVPGMAHCSGAPGANNFGNSTIPPSRFDAAHDITTALDEWVQRGIPPDEFIAFGSIKSQSGQQESITRPICAYPEEAHWSGQGSTLDADNFRCVLPEGKSSRIP